MKKLMLAALAAVMWSGVAWGAPESCWESLERWKEPLALYRGAVQRGFNEGTVTSSEVCTAVILTVEHALRLDVWLGMPCWTQMTDEDPRLMEMLEGLMRSSTGMLAACKADGYPVDEKL